MVRRSTRGTSSLGLVCYFVLSAAFPRLAPGGCFDVFPAAPVFQPFGQLCTNNTCLLGVEMYQSVLFVPNSGSNCGDECPFTNANITVQGGTLLGYGVNPLQLSPQGGLVVFDCAFLQSPGATNAAVTIQNVCATLNASFDYVLKPDLYSFDFLIHVSTNKIFAGAEVEVEWQGAANGVVCVPEDDHCFEQFGTAFGPWEDGVFLTNDSSSRLLATAPFSGSLAPHGSYTQATRVKIPPETLPGTYRIAVKLDYLAGNEAGRIVETDESNNIGTSSITVLAPPPLLFTSATVVSNGVLRLVLAANTDTPFRLQTNSAMSGSTWADLALFPALTGTVTYLDRGATSPARFYRAVAP